MIETKEGVVTEIISQRPGVKEVAIRVGAEERKAVNYVQLTGPIEIGDEVILNTTAKSLGLGTGGYDFVIWVKEQIKEEIELGHIMKLRYTPYQLQVCSVAEEESPYHQKIKEFDSLQQTPVVVGTLHSMLPAISAVIKERFPRTTIAYIMTDGAALPVKFSRLVNYLKQQELIDSTISIGHAFGGELEAVNIYSGLIGADQIVKADVIIVTMGPGIVGTGTKYGFSGTEQATVVHAADVLGGEVIVVPRISFADSRSRHFGLSHHSITNLGELIRSSTTVGIPYFTAARQKVVEKQLKKNNIKQQHEIVYREGESVIEAIEQLEVELTTMGRGLQEDKEYFMTAGVAGLVATNKLKGEILNE